jgi:hypothetical protein
MKLTALADPPNPSDFQNNQGGYNLAMYRWASNLKSQLTVDTRISNRPAAQNFVIGTYTPASTLSGTDTTTNVAQVLCTLITALISKNILKNQIINQ